MTTETRSETVAVTIYPKARAWLISPDGLPARQVVSPIHPCDSPAEGVEPVYAGPRADVVDIETDPENPAWLRYRGIISDETYDRLKAEGLISIKDGRYVIGDRPA